MGRRLKLGMIGGGQGAFIGAVHRLCARMDDKYEFVAGCLSSTPEKAAKSAEEIGLDPSRSYPDFKTMAEEESKRDDGIEVVSIVTPNHMHAAPAIERPRDIVGLLLGLKEGEVLFIDEIHRLNRLTEELLYSAMEDFRLDLTMGANRGARCRTINLPRFTLIGATTKLASISAPLRDRFGISQKIEFYTYDELKQIIVNFSRLINLNLDDEASYDLAKISRGTPRIALRLLRRVRDYAQVVNKTNTISVNLIKKALNSYQIDEKGLDSLDRHYLSFLNQKQ